MRRIGWLCHHFDLPPSDPRLLDMTEEQADDLFLQLKHFSGRPEEEEELRDDEFEEWEKALTEEAEGVLYEDTQVLPFGAKLPEAPGPAEPTEDDWEEIPEGWMPNNY